MAMNGVGGSALNVSPYLTSAMSRIQSGEQAAKKVAGSSANTSTAGQTSGGTRALSNQVIGTLVAMQAENT